MRIISLLTLLFLLSLSDMVQGDDKIDKKTMSLPEKGQKQQKKPKSPKNAKKELKKLNEKPIILDEPDVVGVEFVKLVSRSFPSFDYPLTKLPYPLPFQIIGNQTQYSTSEIQNGEPIPAIFSLLDERHFKNYVHHAQEGITLTAKQIKDLNILIDHRYRLLCLVDNQPLIFDLGYKNTTTGLYYMRTVFNFTLYTDNTGEGKYEVEKLLDDYIDVTPEDEITLLWGSAHQKSKKEFVEPQLGKFSYIVFFFLFVFNAILYIVYRITVISMFKQQYMTLESSDDMDEEIPSKEREKSSSQRVVIKGWRTIKSEVFIPPKNRGVLACLVGNGAHLIMIMLVDCLTELFEVYDDMGDNSILTAGLYYGPSMFINGAIASHVYKSLGGKEFSGLMFTSSLFFLLPFLIILLNITLTQTAFQAITHIHYTTILLLGAFAIATFPLAAFGGATSMITFRYNRIEFKTNVLQLHRRPQASQTFTESPFFLFSLAGIAPFMSVLYFLDFIYDEIWDQANDDQFLYIRVFMCLLLFSLTSYYNGKFFTCLSLDRENSNWCWSSYAYGAAVGVYVLFYSIFYYHNSEMSGMAQYQIYTLYNCITVLFFSLVGGTVSYIGSYNTIITLYGRSKVQ